MKKRVFSLLTALCLCLTLLPGMALATEGETEQITVQANGAIETGEELQAALNEGGTVTLTQDVTLTDTLTITKTVTLDLNGKTLTGSGIEIDGGSLTLMGSSGTVENEVSVESNGSIAAESNGTFAGEVTNYGTIGGGSFTGEVTNYGTINGGEFTGTVTNDKSNSYKDKVGRISGGTFYGKVTNYYGTISKGTFKGPVSNGGESNDKAGTISGGTFNGNVDNNPDSIISGGTFEVTGAVTNISGKIYKGTFYGSVKNQSVGGTGDGGVISGGTFNGTVTNNGTIGSGTFKGTVMNEKGGKIDGGTFEKNVTNNGAITNGTFEGTVENNEGGKIEGGDFEGEISGKGTVYLENLPVYTVTFKLDDNTEYATTRVTKETIPISDPGVPTTKLGYTFNWVYNGTVWNFNKSIADNVGAANVPTKITLTAKWNANPYAITYDLDGGTNHPRNPDSYTIETETFSLKNPTKPGYTFTGWSGTKLTGENNLTVTIEKGSTGDRSYTAHWRYNGGSSGGSSSYPITVPDKTENGSVTISPKNASKGSTVTISVTPDSGYVLETISVTDKNGDELKLTDKGNGKYTFIMPGSKVEVKVTFMEDNSVLNFFYDVPNDAYYYEAVKWAVENGITGGIGNSLFAPNQPCTRAQIVTFLWRVAGSPVVNYLIPFTDVDESAYYAEAVRWAASTGIVTGLTETTFGTNGVCTRAQAAAMIYRYAQAQGKGFTGAWMFLLPFTDVPEWAYESVAWCYMNGVTTGVSETAFAPGNDCTRAQIVTFLWRAFSK